MESYEEGSMYSFVDIKETSEGITLPSEAMQINGEYLENLVAGYRTLSVSGREALSPEIESFHTGIRDGSSRKSRRYPERIITVKYQLISKSNEEFREAYNKLGGVLNMEDAQLVFRDEPDKYFIGTPSLVEEVEQGRNAVVTLKLSYTKPTRTNYNFKGWGTSSSSITVSYAAGGNYTSNASITLYAIWELAYTAPRLSDFSVARCASDGKESENGTYVKVDFKWATDKTVTAIKIEYKTETSTTWTATTVTGTGTSGTVSKIIGGSLSTEYAYNIRITVSDSAGSSSSIKDIPSMHYIVDIRSTGKGIAFGKPSQVDDVADFNYNLRLRKALQMMIAGRVRIPFELTEGDENGDGMQIRGANGYMAIGSGESVSDYVTDSNIVGGDEGMYITADTLVKIITNMQAGYANRKEYEFNASGDFKVPGNIYSNDQKVLTEGSLTLEPELLWSGENETGKDIIINSPVEEYTKLIFVYKRNDGFFYNATFLVSTLLKTTEESGVQQMFNVGADTTVYVFPKDHKKIRVWMTSNLKVLELYGQKY